MSYKLVGLLLGIIAVILLQSSYAQRLTWSRMTGSAAADYATAVARDTNGAFYVAGYTLGSFDGQTNAGGYDAFLTKFDSAGNVQWSRIWGSSADESVKGIAVDRSNCVYVAGTTHGSFGGENNTQEPLQDFFLTKWSRDGSQVWTRIWGSTSNDVAAGVVADRFGNVYVAGYTFGQFGTPGQTNTRLGRADFCLSSLSASSGAFQWSSIWGSTNSDYCYGVAMDPYDWLFLVGTTPGGKFMDQTNNFAVDRLVITAFFEGLPRWSRVWGATNKHNQAYGVYADHAGYVYVVGRTFGSFDGQPFQTNAWNNPDFFVTCLDADNRTQIWTRLRGGTSMEEAYAVWSDGAGSVYVGGVTFGDFDGQVRAGGSDFLLVKFTSDGSHQWTRFGGSSSDEYGIQGLTADPSGNIFTCGSTFGSFGGQTNPGSDSAVLSRWRMTANTAPQAMIWRPLAMREYLQGEQIYCIGAASDEDDGTLTNLIWTIGTNVVPVYGTTGFLTTAVSPGVQSVYLRAMDTEGATGTAQVAVQVLETSEDGLPVAWQTNYWPANNGGGSTADPDGDGVDNFTEWLTGTDPTDSHSYLRLAIAAANGSYIILAWPSTSNLSYGIYAAEDMGSGNFSLLTAPEPTPPSNSYTATVESTSSRFFQLRTER